MKNILYLSCSCEENYIKKHIGNNPEIFAYQAQKYHMLLIKGFSKNKDITIKTISTLPVNNKNCKKMYIQKNRIVSGNLEYNHLSILNLPIFKNIHTMINSFFKILSIKKKEKTIMVGDVLNISLIIGGLLASKLKKIKTVGIITDVPQFLSEKENSVNVKINNRIINLFDSYVFLTQEMNKLINSKNKPYVVIEGQVDCEMINIQNDLSNKYKKKVCIYAGSLKKVYGIENLVKAFIEANIEDSELRIYGNGEFREELIQICTKNTKIKYMGTMSNELIVKEEVKATLLINPRPTNEEYTKYSFPSKNMEYMASGTPILTTNLPGMPKEYIEHVYLIEDETVNGISKKIAEVLSKSKEELQKKGLIAKAFVMKEKNNTIQTKKIIDMVGKFEK